MTPSIGVPNRPLGGFPTIEATTDLPLYRSTATDRTPWWFGSDGSQRFDLNPPHGTCYLALDIETAVRERGRERLLSTGMLSPAFIAAMNVYELRLPSDITVANLTAPAAVRFGANRELATTEDYSVSCAWAVGLHAQGLGGIGYASRYTSAAEVNSLALFGDAGDAGWGWEQKLPGRMALVGAGLGDLIQEPPTLAQATIVAPPPLK